MALLCREFPGRLPTDFRGSWQMPRVSETVIRTEVDRLMELLRQATGALNPARLSEAYRGAHGTELPRRTLQRRFERLVGRGSFAPTVRADAPGTS
jgi:hypothetical protein